MGSRLFRRCTALLCVALTTAACLPREEEPDHPAVVLSADLAWADDGYIYFAKPVLNGGLDNQVWRTRPGEEPTLFDVEQTPGCPSRSLRNLQRLAGNRLAAVMECSGGELTGKAVAISTVDGSIRTLAAPTGIVGAVWNPDATRGWVQYNRDGCVQLADSRAPRASVAAYQLGIMPVVDGDDLYFFTSLPGGQGCRHENRLDLCRLSGGRLERMRTFTQLSALAVQDGRVFVAATYKGQAGLWFTEGAEPSMVRSGDFRAMVFSPDRKTLLVIDSYRRIGATLAVTPRTAPS